MPVFALLIMIIHLSNKVKFKSNVFENYSISFNKAINFKEIIENYKNIINASFTQWRDKYEIIYFCIYFNKKYKEQSNVQIINSPQEIIYVWDKLFLKTLNEFIKMKKYNLFAYQ